MNIYVASSWRNKYYESVITALSAFHFDFYDFRNPPNKSGFGWEQINENWETWSFDEYKKALSSSLALDGYASDIAALNNADICLIVLPCGRSAHLEAGIACGAGKTTIAYIPEMIEPELMYKSFDFISDDIFEILSYLVKKIFVRYKQTDE